MGSFGLGPWRRRATAMLRDLRELAWAVGVLLLATAGLGVFTRDFFGPWALGVTLGLVAYVAVVFALILTANLLAVAAYDLVVALRRRCRGG